MALHEITPRDLTPTLDARLSALLDEIGAGSGTLAFGRGTYRIEGSYTVGPSVSWWFEPGAVLDVQGELTIQGAIFAAPKRIFATRLIGEMATSSVNLDAKNGQKIAEVLPEWWGAGPQQSSGHGLQAMAASLRGAGRLIISFGAEFYSARPMRLNVGQRLVSSRGATIQALLTDQPLIELKHEGADEAPKTSFEGLGFVGAAHPSPDSMKPPSDLVVVQSSQGAVVPLSVVDCSFSVTRGSGLVVPTGAIIQATALSASDCGRAGLEFRPSPQETQETPVTVLQWSNPTQGTTPPFDAAVVVNAPGKTAIVQLADVKIGGRLEISGDSASRVTLVRCSVKGALVLNTPGAQTIATDSAFNMARTNADAIGIKAPAVSIWGGCSAEGSCAQTAQEGRVQPTASSLPSLLGFSRVRIDQDAEELSNACSALDIDWENRAGAVLVADTRLRTMQEQASSVGIHSRDGSGPASRLMVDGARLEGQETGIKLNDGASLLAQRLGAIPERALALASLDDRPNPRLLRVVAVAQVEGVDALGLKLRGDGALSSVSFKGVAIPVSEAPPLEFDASEQGSVVWGGRLLAASEAFALALGRGELDLGGLRGDQIVVDGRPVLVCITPDARQARWRLVGSGALGPC